MSWLSNLFTPKPSCLPNIRGEDAWNEIKRQLAPWIVDSTSVIVMDRLLGTVTDEIAFQASRDTSTIYTPEINDCDDKVKAMEFWFLKRQTSRKSPWAGKPAAFGRAIITTTGVGHMIGVFITPEYAVHFVDADGRLVTLQELNTVTIRSIHI